MTLSNGQWVRLALVSTAALALAACDSTGTYRVASVGATPDAGSTSGDNGGGSGGSAADNGSGSGSGSGTTAGGSGSGSGTTTGAGSGTSASGGSQSSLGERVLVTSGNAMIGAAGTQAALTDKANIPHSGIASAKVSRVLTRTGQTLVTLGNGSTLVLNGTGGKIGDAVSLDLGKGKVVGAPSGSSSLVGLNVLARNPSTGRLATVGGASGGNLVSVTVPNSTSGLVSGARTTSAGLVNSARNTGVTAGVNGAVTSGVGAVSTIANAAVKPATGVNVGTVTNVATKPVTGTVSTVTGVTPK